jgi:hypothetical protein
VRWINGGNLVVQRIAFEAVGGFDESLETGEDVELCYRLVQAGYLLVHDRRISATHLGNPKTLRDFVRQQWWHGVGDPRGSRPITKPLIMSGTHLALTLGSVLFVALGSSSWWVALAALAGGQLVVPVITVAFRAVQTGKLRFALRSILLYHLYYWSRLAALSTAVLGVPKAPKGRR